MSLWEISAWGAGGKEWNEAFSLSVEKTLCRRDEMAQWVVPDGSDMGITISLELMRKLIMESITLVLEKWTRGFLGLASQLG